EAAHSLGTDLLEDAVELIEELLLLGPAAAAGGGHGASGRRLAGALVVRDDLELPLVHHLPETAERTTRSGQAQVQERGDKAAEVRRVCDVVAARIDHRKHREDGE